jgi:hypothetical protein
MKRVLLIALTALMIAGGAAADHISIYSDLTATTCFMSTLQPPPANNAVYIIHRFNGNGASASQFKVNDLSGLFAASQTTTFLVLGTWNTDLSVSYGGCVVGDIAVMTLNFLWFGTPISGCNNTLTVVAAPTSPIPGEIATVECDFATLTSASGGRFFFGLNSGTCCVDPTQENTWGGIKALYH